MSKPDPLELRGRPDRTALLVIDMQNDFVLPGAALATPRAMAIVPLVAALTREARANGYPVIFTREQHRPDGSDYGIELCFEPRHCEEGMGGDEIVEGLEPEPGDLVILRKRRYDAFLGTDLDLWLRNHGIENLLVTGVCTDICVISTVQHARNLDYRVFLIEDGVDGTSAERHRAALLCMSHVFAYVGKARDIAPLFGMDVQHLVGAPG
jgi:nicotinamidase-related amidase